MSDIFLSYAREDLERARQLASALERHGWDVFWDRTIPAGQKWRQYIGRKLDETRCVLVAWSAASIESDWVMEEAEDGREKNALFPVLFEPVKPPRGFRAIQAEDLSVWDGSEKHPAFQKLVRALEVYLAAARTTGPDNGQRISEKLAPCAPRPSLVPGTVFRDTLKDGSQGPEMIVIPAGEFRMGDIHAVTVNLSKPFALGKFQITFDEYGAFGKATKISRLPNDKGWGRGRRPVINVSWEDTQAYAKWLSEQTGKCYRLPSESEWEYAARSGGKDEFWAGTSNEKELAEFAWFDANSAGKTQEVGTMKSNGLGLHDMSGNVWEWVEDCWHDNYESAPTDGRAWKEENGGDCGQRVLRGGAWDNRPVSLRSSFRARSTADLRDNFLGFRLAQDLR